MRRCVGRFQAGPLLLSGVAGPGGDGGPRLDGVLPPPLPVHRLGGRLSLDLPDLLQQLAGHEGAEAVLVDVGVVPFAAPTPDRRPPRPAPRTPSRPRR